MASIISVFSFNLYLFAVCIFAVNFGFRGFMNSCVIYISEISSDNMRNLAPNLLNFCWALG